MPGTAHSYLVPRCLVRGVFEEEVRDAPVVAGLSLISLNYALRIANFTAHRMMNRCMMEMTCSGKSKRACSRHPVMARFSAVCIQAWDVIPDLALKEIEVRIRRTNPGIVPKHPKLIQYSSQSQ